MIYHLVFYFMGNDAYHVKLLCTMCYTVEEHLPK